MNAVVSCYRCSDDTRRIVIGRYNLDISTRESLLLNELYFVVVE